MSNNGKSFIIIGIVTIIIIIFVYFNNYDNYFYVYKFSSVKDYKSDINIETNHTSKIQDYLFNILFVETNENKTNLSLKQLCAIESAALNNPNALINFFSVGPVVDEYLTKRYKNIQTRKFSVQDVFKDTPMNDWWKNYEDKIRKGEFNLVHTSDALRVALIWKYGGIYLDTDTITIRNLNYLLNFPGVGAQDKSTANNAVINFPKNHRFTNELIKEFVKNYNPKCWGCKGPELFTQVFKNYCKTKDFYITNLLTNERMYDKIINSYLNNNTNTNQCDIYIYPINYFYPIIWSSSEKMFKDSKIDFDKFLDTYIIHFWNKSSKKYHAKSGDHSIFGYFSNLNCPIVNKMNPNLVF